MNLSPLNFLKKLKLAVAGCGCFAGIVVLASLAWVFIAPIDAAMNIASEAGSFFSKTWNLITLGHFTETENAWYAELNEQYELFSKGGIYIDRALIASALFYDQPMDLSEDYVENITEEDLDEALEDKENGSSSEINYRSLVSEARTLSMDFAKVHDSEDKDEEIRKILVEKFLPDKFKSLGYKIPKTEGGKKKVFEEAADFIYLKRDLYDSLFNDKGQCQFTQNPEYGSASKARITTYVGTSLGGTLGNMDKYFKDGSAYYDENGYIMLKGGTKGYGSEGKDYLIVATATRLLIDKQFTKDDVTYSWKEDPSIKYFEYGDTFTLKLDIDGKEKIYNAIVLDSCGACMDFSTTSDGYWAPKNLTDSATRERELRYAAQTNNLKIDIFRKDSNSEVKVPATIGEYIPGTSSGICFGTIDLGYLEIGHKGLKSLNKPLTDVIGQQGVDELSQQIAANVNRYGKGTGNAAAAAAITLINGLKQQGVYLPYFWGGGHDKVVTGVPNNLGVSTVVWASGHHTSGTPQPYSYDCSGFVMWAMRNSGCGAISSTSRDFANYGPAIKDIRNAKPGDILDTDGHVLMVVQNNGGIVTGAESGGVANGVGFVSLNNYYNLHQYKIIDMTDYYAKNCRG